MVVRVITGPLDPPSLGEGFEVVLSDAAGDLAQVTTDPMGFANLPITRPAGPFEVTVARVGFTAVSVLQIPGPTELEVYVRPTNLSRPSGVTTRRISGSVTGRASPENSLVLQGYAGSQAGRFDRYDTAFEDWPGAPPMEPLVIEYDGAMRMVNAARASVPRAPMDLSVDLALPSPPARVESINLGVEFPFVGLVTPMTFDAVQVQDVLRLVPSSAGPRAIHYGVSDLQRPDSLGVARWHLDSLGEPLLPSLYWASWRHAAPQPILASVGLRPPFRGLRPAMGVVEALQVDATPTGPTITAHFTRYDHAGFEVRSSNTNDNGQWIGFTFGATQLTRMPLPSLPRGVSLRSIFTDSRPGQVTARACVVRRLPDAPRPWRADTPLVLQSEATACTTVGPAVQ